MLRVSNRLRRALGFAAFFLHFVMKASKLERKAKRGKKLNKLYSKLFKNDAFARISEPKLSE